MGEERMRLRSSVSEEEKRLEKEKIFERKKQEENRPFIKFTGEISYSTNFIDCAIICDKLLETANKTEEFFVVGFDIEWPFSFQEGSGPTAVIQISPTLNLCYIIHVSAFKKLPKNFCEFLAHPKVRITGNNIKNDIRKLSRDFPGLETELILENCIDSGVFCNSVLPFKQKWSLEKLVGYLLKMKMCKDKKVRMSKWHIVPLNKEQQIYAATDAYASLLIFQHLKTIQRENDDI